MEIHPLFLSTDEVIEYHDELIRESGGLEGLADWGSLDSAVHAPINLYLHRSDADLFDLATAYAFHISECQAFNEGHKRTGLKAAISFLKLNNYAFLTSTQNAFDWMIALAKEEMSRPAFAQKLCAHSVREKGFTDWLRSFLRL